MTNEHTPGDRLAPAMSGRRWIGRVTHRLSRLPGSKALARLQARLIRWTGGRLGAWWFSGMPVLVLRVQGRKTGALRETPLIYIEQDGNPVVVAANAGAQHTPNWWLNLRAAGEATAIVRGKPRTVRPVEVDGALRAELVRRYEDAYPPTHQYYTYTERQFPVIVLETVPANDAADR